MEENKLSLNAKISGSILNTVLVISVIITAITSALILLAYYRNLVLLHNQIAKELQQNVSSGTNYFLANSTIPYNTLHAFDLYGEKKDTVAIVKKAWGVFDVGLITAFRAKRKAERVILIGANLGRFGRTSLYLIDENRPLSISGSTQIKGKVFLPKAGIKTSYVNGSGFLGDKMVDGHVDTSASQFPEFINQHFTKRLLSYQEPVVTFLTTAEPLTIIQDRKISNSFFNPGLVLNSGQDLLVSKTNLRGQIIIKSGGTVTLDKTAKLEDVLLLAPKVIIKSGFQGSVQIFASDSIFVEDQVQLNYPSVLSVYSRSNSGNIAFGKGSSLEGIIYLDTDKVDSPKNTLKIAEGSTLTGQVYVNGMVEHKGTLYGSLFCRRLFLITASTIYENQLYNAVLDNSKLPTYFLTSNLISSSSQPQILKWLD